jgi:hypothetical protein
MSFGGSSASVEKHLKKMMRKCLLLTLDSNPKTGQLPLLSARLPSHLHVAAIMNELTPDEKQTFGQVNLAEISKPRPSNQLLALKASQTANSIFTEDKVDWLIETYMSQLRSPFELIQKTLERSRDRF